MTEAGMGSCFPTQAELGWGTRRLDEPIQTAPLRLVHQHVHVLGHDNIPQHRETIPLADCFECRLEQAGGLGLLQVREAMVAAEGEEVQVAALLVTMESARHGGLE
jgi:hypothetical protein